MSKPQKISISVIICTHNRADILDQSLSYYAKLRSKISYEILLVLNACTDHTEKIAQKYAHHNPHLIYIKENKLGLSHARNSGYKAAKGAYVFYIDDDAYPDPDILLYLQECIDQKINAFTGRTLYWPLNSPEWILPEYVASSHYAETLSPLPSGGYINGCVAGFKKEALEKVGGFDPKYGMSGKKIAYYEEVLMQRKLDDLGYTAYYHPQIQVYHQSHHKTVFQFLKSDYLKGVSRRNAGHSSSLKSLFFFFVTGIKGLFMFASILLPKGYKRAIKESFSLPAIYLGQVI